MAAPSLERIGQRGEDLDGIAAAGKPQSTPHEITDRGRKNDRTLPLAAETARDAAQDAHRPLFRAENEGIVN